MGLLPEAARSPGKHRLYPPEAVKTVKMIKQLQKQHYSLDEICHLLNSKEHEELMVKMVSVREHLDSLQKEIAELFPALQMIGGNRQVELASKELANKGMRVLQVLMVLLGETI